MFNLLQPVTTETTEGGETASSEGAIVVAQTTGEATPADEVQAGEATSTDLAAPADSEEPSSSSEIPLAEVAAESEEALLGKWLSSPGFPVAHPYDKSYHTE